MKQHVMVKVLIHSSVDVITNSSTEIFVHSDASLEPAKELLSELLRINGSDKKCDEVFEVSLEYDIRDIDDIINFMLEEHGDELEDAFGFNPYDANRSAKFKQCIINIENGERNAPEWYYDFEMDYNVKTWLVIKSNDDRYNEFINILDKFLYSPEYYDHSND